MSRFNRLAFVLVFILIYALTVFLLRRSFLPQPVQIVEDRSRFQPPGTDSWQAVLYVEPPTAQADAGPKITLKSLTFSPADATVLKDLKTTPQCHGILVLYEREGDIPVTFIPWTYETCNSAIGSAPAGGDFSYSVEVAIDSEPHPLSPRSRFWYPFDDFTFRFFTANSAGHPANGQGHAGNPLTNVTLNLGSTPDWIGTVTQETHPGGLNAFSVRFERPGFLKASAPLLLGVILLFIVLLTLVDSVDAFIQGGAAVFFGLFGLRAILVPPTFNTLTVIDIAIYGLYFVFAASTLPRVIILLSKPHTLQPATPSPRSEPKSAQRRESAAGLSLVIFRVRAALAGLTTKKNKRA